LAWLSAFHQAALRVPRASTEVKPSCSFLAMRLTSVDARGAELVRLMKAKKQPVFAVLGLAIQDQLAQGFTDDICTQ